MKINNFNIIIFAIVAIASIAAISARMDSDIWFDESYSIAYAKKDLLYILQPHDVHPPLYYTTLKAWMTISDNQYYIRVLSLIFAIGSAVLLYKIVQKKYNTEAALLSVFTLGLSTTFWYYSTEVRMYAMLHFLGLLMFYSILKYENDGWSLWPAMLIGMAMMFTHYMAIFYIGMMLIYIFFMIKPGIKESIKIAAIQMTLCIPAIWYFFLQAQRVDGLWFDRPDAISIFSTFYFYFFKGMGLYTAGKTLIGLGILAFIIFMIWKYVSIAAKEDKFVLFLVLMCILPVFGLWSFNIIGLLDGYHHRFFYVESWAAILLFSLAVYRMKDMARKIVYGAFIAFVMINLFWFVTERQMALQESSDIIKNKECLPIVHNTQETYLPYKYYIRDESCYKPWMFTDITERQMNSAGGDAFDRSQLFNDTSQISKELNRFYYVLPYKTNRSGDIEKPSLFNISSENMIYHTDGLEVYIIYGAS